MSKLVEAGLVLFAVAWVVGLSILVGYAIADTKMRKEAVEAGAAHYVITDPATGATEFVWIVGDSAERTDR